MHTLGGWLFLIFDFFQWIGSDNLMVNGKVNQSVQPTKAMVGLRCSEVLVSFQINLVFPSELLGDVRKAISLISFDSKNSRI